MDDLSRTEYPTMLTHLQPLQAAQTLDQRHKRIGKLNVEIAEWLQERRRIEEQYVMGLRKLTMFKAPNASSELGVFLEPWQKIIQATATLAQSHHAFTERVEKDVELPLRTFQNKREYTSMVTIHGNLVSMARDLEEAQERADKATRKAGKTSAQKAEMASTRLESATQQWESQAPYVFEQLQALDEQRLNHLRDILTQYQTHESDQAQRAQANAEEVLNAILEINTANEIASFAARVIGGKPRLEKRTSTRGSAGPSPGASAGPAGLTPTQSSSLAPPSTVPTHDDDTSDHSGRNEGQVGEGSRLRSRIGTMLGRRRQSVHGGFGPISPVKGPGSSLGRGLTSAHGRLSPRGSQNNLAESSASNRLSSLVESPDSPNRPSAADKALGSLAERGAHDGPNGVGGGSSSEGAAAAKMTNGTDDAADIFDYQPPPGPPPGHKGKEPEGFISTPALIPTPAVSQPPKQDADGFTIPPAPNDPISAAEREAAAEADGAAQQQAFKLSIAPQSVADAAEAEVDADANKAAVASVASTLSQMAAPVAARRSGTVRGRRADVRSTIIFPSPSEPSSFPSASASSAPSSPPLPNAATGSSLGSFPPAKPSAVSALASEASGAAAASDAQSIRSSTHSLGGLLPKHPDMLAPGLNASIIETVVASFDAGEVKTVKVSGEIAFAYNFSAQAGTDNKQTVRINGFDNIESVSPNSIFVQAPSSSAGEYVLDVSHLSKTSVAFTYKLQGGSDDDGPFAPPPPPALQSRVPLLLRAAWKPAGDKLGLVLEYALNPAAAAAAVAHVQNLILVASYEGRATSAQSRPTCTHLRDKHMVYWRVPDAALAPGQWHKVVCRVSSGPAGAAAAAAAVEAGAELKPGRVEARWEYVPAAATPADVTLSRLEPAPAEGKGKEKAAAAAAAALGDDLAEEPEADPFADEQLTPQLTPQPGNAAKWVDVPLVTRVVSGKYEVV